jgi:hypothetical protein
MTVRLLPRDEWDRLKALTPILCVLPENARILVAEDEAGVIIGHVAEFQAWHVDGLWIDPRYRDGSVWRRLLHQVQADMHDRGVRGVVTASISDAMTDYLTRMGATPQPGTALIWPFEDVCLQQ